MPPPWIVIGVSVSTSLLVDTFRYMDWTCFTLLSHWKEVCIEYWPVIEVISGNLQILGMTAFSVLSHWDHGNWYTDMKIHWINEQDEASIPAKCHWNSLKNNRESRVQQIFQYCLIVTIWVIYAFSYWTLDVILGQTK